MNWFSFVFANTALVTATFAIGRAFSCKAINIVEFVMVFPLVLMYFFVCGMMIELSLYTTCCGLRKAKAEMGDLPFTS